MYRYLFIVSLVVLPAYGQLVDEAPQSHDTLEQPEMFAGEPPVKLADEADEPDSGNWYNKLKWWKDAKWLYTIDIKAAMDELLIISQEYDDQKQAILSALEGYSISLPLKRQAAVQVIDDLLEDLIRRQEEIAQEQTQTQVRRVPEESTELEQHRKQLDQLKTSFTDFNTLNQRIKQAFEVVVPKQIQDAQSFDQSALEAYESIEQTLDDKKAQAKYDEVENNLENIRAIMNYLKGPLWSFVDTSWKKAQQLMPQIKNRIKELEDQGVVVRPLTAQEKTEMVELEKKRKELRAKKAAERKAAQERQARPWWQKLFSSIGSFFGSIGSAIWSGITMPFVWLGGLFSPATEVPKAKPIPQKTQPKKS